MAPDGDCALFVAASVEITNPGITIADASLESADASLMATDFTPEFAAGGDLAIETFSLVEIDLCKETGPGGPEIVPTQLSIRFTAEGRIRIEFPTVPGLNYLLRRTTTLAPADWQPLETIPGTGAVAVEEFDVPAASSFFRVETILP